MRMPLPSVKKISTKVALSYVLIAILQGGLSILTLNFVTTQAMEASLDDQRLTLVDHAGNKNALPASAQSPLLANPLELRVVSRRDHHIARHVERRDSGYPVGRKRSPRLHRVVRERFRP